MAQNTYAKNADPIAADFGYIVRPINSAATPLFVVTTEQTSSTCTNTQVADSASSVTLLAANTSRLGASVFNNSDQILYAKCGTTASATDFTTRIMPYEYWEVPFGYDGRIDGIWANNSTGSANVAEYTA